MNTKCYVYDDGSIKDKNFKLMLFVDEKFFALGKFNLGDFTRDGEIDICFRKEDKTDKTKFGGCKVQIKVLKFE
jgi:hypothetical protein